MKHIYLQPHTKINNLGKLLKKREAGKQCKNNKWLRCLFLQISVTTQHSIVASTSCESMPVNTSFNKEQQVFGEFVLFPAGK